MSLQKRAMGDDALLEFIKVSFIKIQENAYIEKMQAGVSDNPVRYLPYFITCQVKKRIVYYGGAKFNEVCINDYISSGPDMLNRLSHILA